jgi:hypothetical protein
MCSEVEAGNFTATQYTVLLNVGKSVLKMTENLRKNHLIIAKVISIIAVNFVVIALTCSEKKFEALLLYRPLYKLRWNMLPPYAGFKGAG